MNRTKTRLLVSWLLFVVAFSLFGLVHVSPIAYVCFASWLGRALRD